VQGNHVILTYLSQLSIIAHGRLVIFVVIIVIICRVAESREPSPELMSCHKPFDELDNSFILETTDLPPAASDAVIDTKGYFHLPELPDFAGIVPSHDTIPKHSSQQLLEDICAVEENADINVDKSEVMVCFTYHTAPHYRLFRGQFSRVI